MDIQDPKTPQPMPLDQGASGTNGGSQTWLKAHVVHGPSREHGPKSVFSTECASLILRRRRLLKTRVVVDIVGQAPGQARLDTASSN